MRWVRAHFPEPFITQITWFVPLAEATQEGPPVKAVNVPSGGVTVMVKGSSRASNDALSEKPVHTSVPSGTQQPPRAHDANFESKITAAAKKPPRL
jgi:hypothetical protein